MLVLFYMYRHHHYHTCISFLKREVATMVVKINQKPIKVYEDNEEEQPKGWIYVAVSSVGYLSILVLMDMICHIFLSSSPFPFLSWIWRLFV